MIFVRFDLWKSSFERRGANKFWNYQKNKKAATNDDTSTFIFNRLNANAMKAKATEIFSQCFFYSVLFVVVLTFLTSN